MSLQEYAGALEGLYQRFNHRRYVHPDPLEFLYEYDELADREVVGLLASSLAFGKVEQILLAIRKVLVPMGQHPYQFLMNTPVSLLKRLYAGFRYRFCKDSDLLSLLAGIRKVIKRFGSLGACFAHCYDLADETILPALTRFIIELDRQGNCRYLLPDAAGRSALKRLNLFLRWMVRSDEVDPGGWSFIQPSKLIIPLDTHMHRVALALGMTQRRTADMLTAIEITTAFRKIVPEDPVRYDFSLTRIGIRNELDLPAFVSHIRAGTKI